jgi:hypothetical protein
VVQRICFTSSLPTSARGLVVYKGTTVVYGSGIACVEPGGSLSKRTFDRDAMRGLFPSLVPYEAREFDVLHCKESGKTAAMPEVTRPPSDASAPLPVLAAATIPADVCDAIPKSTVPMRLGAGGDLFAGGGAAGGGCNQGLPNPDAFDPVTTGIITVVIAVIGLAARRVDGQEQHSAFAAAGGEDEA